MKTITFKDRVRLYVEAGNGGDGCVAFRREKYVPRGGPSGGDGGHGGSVYIQAATNADSLLDLYYKPHQRAAHGGKGQNKDRHGKNGEELVLPVPCGTIASDHETGERIGEVVADGDRLRLAKGGRGGLGNIHFATSSHQAPRESTPGTPGEHKTITLELKLVADVGLVGFPNAGKSTLLSRLTNAHPKIAPYPFTTLNPVIGTMLFEDYKTLLIADVPGLINGAHAGVGLGHEFLRHIERTRFLLIVLDMAGTDGRHPADDYEALLNELGCYQAALLDLPRAVVANKMDVPEAGLYLKEFIQRSGVPPLRISADHNEGIEQIKTILYPLIQVTEPSLPEGARHEQRES